MELIYLHQAHPSFQCGGKANQLFQLRQLQLRVPPFVVIPAEMLEAYIGELSDFDEIRKTIDAIPIQEADLYPIFEQLSPNGFYAVRSSGLEEDGQHQSFAGQFESHLYVHKAEMGEKIKSVWKSAFSERVALYRRTNNLQGRPGIAVIIQEMIPAESAGVAFSVHPVSGNRNEKLISAVFGLGEGLVSGELNADNFTYIQGEKIRVQLADKKEQITFDSRSGKGTQKQELPSEKWNLPVLNDDQVKEVADCLDVLLKTHQRHQDIEFAYYQNKFYVLQARPITTLNKLADHSSEFIVWDNSNIIESYPGVTTPLTFSFILKVYEAVYRQFVAIMGVTEQEIDDNKEVFANMLGLIDGRVYYNLLSWYRALALLPGYQLNAEFMEKMMGVKQRFELKSIKKHSRLKERMRVLQMIRIIWSNLRALPKMRIQFQAEFEETMQEYQRIDFSKKNSWELMQLYLRFEQTLLKKWKAPLVNDFFAMIYFGVLQKLCIKYQLDETGTLHNDLLCGAKDIISTEPIHRCLKIADTIQADGQLKNLFLQAKPEEIWNKLQNHYPGESVTLQIKEYIQKFGDRCVGELKLEVITYKQDPLVFIKIIKSYVTQGVSTSGTLKNTDEEIRRQAEQTVSEKLRGKWWKKKVFHYFLNKTRDLVSSRENLRYERTRAFGTVRELFLQMGANWETEGILTEKRDIFYLSKEEIFDFIKGTSVFPDLKEMVGTRKKSYENYQKKIPSERIETYGMVYHGNDFFRAPSTAPLDGDIKGIGCCAGLVRAKVQVIHNPSEIESLNGDILVTSSTDPGWVTLFPTASGILVERGSLLSHSAIVSREMGKPCIVGITGLLHLLKTGDEVEMDGSTGVVKVIGKK